MIPFPVDEARRIVALALEEDLGPGGDVTTRATLDPAAFACAHLVAREPMVVAGLPLSTLVFEEAARRALVEAPTIAARVDDGARVPRGEVLLAVEGKAYAILAGERVLLNLVARLSGIATLTAEAVAEIEGTRARVADTRKTTPLLRTLEKYAVALGGGENHRRTLDELVLVKDNHKHLAGGIDAVVDALSRRGFDLGSVEIEVETEAEFERALAAGAGWILLDNMAPDTVHRCALRAAGRVRLEVSGGLRPGNLRAYADAGVDRLSLGMLTHGARAMDVALDVVGKA